MLFKIKNMYKNKIIFSLKKILLKLRLFYLFDFLRKSRFFYYRFHHPYLKVTYKKGKVIKTKHENINTNFFLKRLSLSVRERIYYEPTAEWKGNFNNQTSNRNGTNIVDLLNNKDFSNIQKMLSDPLSNDLMYGFDNLCKSLHNKLRIETLYETRLTADYFIALAEYLGVINYQSPESLTSWKKKNINLNLLIERIISKVFKRNIIFPNLYKGEKGLDTKFGIASLRVPSSIYQAIKVTKLGTNICEIGPGLGRTAYFAKLLGAKKYTLVDLPICSLSQGYFLINSLPNSSFSFSGDDEIEEGIEFRVPDDFFGNSTNYDVILNVDSITEIGINLAKKYLKEIVKKTNYFLSINHECKEYTVRNLSKEFKELKLISSSRSWIRPGYIEELYEIKK